MVNTITFRFYLSFFLPSLLYCLLSSFFLSFPPFFLFSFFPSFFHSFILSSFFLSLFLSFSFFLSCLTLFSDTLNTLQSESAYIRIHTNRKISISRFHLSIPHEKTFPTNTNLSYLPLVVSQQVPLVHFGRVVPRARQGKLLTPTAKCYSWKPHTWHAYTCIQEALTFCIQKLKCLKLCKSGALEISICHIVKTIIVVAGSLVVTLIAACALLAARARCCTLLLIVQIFKSPETECVHAYFV